MKALPCLTKTCSTQSAEGLYRGRAILGDRGLYLLGRAPVRFPFAYTCRSCKRPSTITAVDWNRLPALSVADLGRLGVLENLTQDLRGAGFEPAQAVDLYAAGYHGPSVLEPLVWDDETKRQFQAALVAEPVKEEVASEPQQE